MKLTLKLYVCKYNADLTAAEHINKLLLSPMITIKYFKMKSTDAIKLMDSRRNIKL